MVGTASAVIPIEKLVGSYFQKLLQLLSLPLLYLVRIHIMTHDLLHFTSFDINFRGHTWVWRRIAPPSISLADNFGGQGSAAGTRVNSDPESLLRYGLPINNKEVREIQTSVEQAKANLRTRRQSFAKGDLQKTAELLKKNGAKVVASMPSNHKEEVNEKLVSMMNSCHNVLEYVTCREIRL